MYQGSLALELTMVKRSRAIADNEKQCKDIFGAWKQPVLDCVLFYQ